MVTKAIPATTDPPAQPGGELGDQLPSFEKAQSHKIYLENIKWWKKVI